MKGAEASAESRDRLRAALAGAGEGEVGAAAEGLLGALGYRSERRPPAMPSDASAFLGAFPPNGKAGTKSERAFREEVRAARLLFQITDSEVRPAANSLFGAGNPSFESGLARSFLFGAVELKAEHYPRSAYAGFAREINRRLGMPAAVVFRSGAGLLTLAFVHRRRHRTRDDRDVLGRVSLIREVRPNEPHRAHLDILWSLHLEARLGWMRTHGKARNFDGLLAAWLSALDTEELNRRFYRDLYGWFERAVGASSFPETGPRVLPPEEQVIRLITRLMFVWFLKEKGLIAEELFAEETARRLLRDYDRERGDSYYRAVLQNLFFATLNTEVGARRFSRQTNADHRNFGVYRYRDEIADPDALLALFARTPFVNGGLFDCLDDFHSRTAGGSRVDCFTDNPEHRRAHSIPNRVFFSEDPKAPGLFPLFGRYRFTVEESTPSEQEVALDPELLGRVFENLLAAYNPESRETARKQTGSYYTPRAVVDYMAEEALARALAAKAGPGAEDEWWSERLRYLLDYEDACDDAEGLFEPGERKALVRAVADLTVLDPAVGSGAFPMGVLHKLTLALRRLDPENELWEGLQKERALRRAESAFDEPGQADRDRELREISEVFERYRDSDYGRKLYLIQNALFGVDIQPIACQIAKLRFFITLAIEQTPTDDAAANYGIRPLPNLETRFVVADSLRSLRNGARMLGQNGGVEALEEKLAQNRERHFHATERQEKLRCLHENRELRGELEAALREEGFSAGTAEKVAQWDPYDQNERAAWFDPAYMFHRRDGFEVIVGNPPYVEARSSMVTEAAKKDYAAQVDADWGSTLPRGSDLLIYFYARAAKLLRPRGVGAFITQNAWLSTDYGKKFQDFTRDRMSFFRVVDTRGKFFSETEGPNINAVITFFDRRKDPFIRYQVLDERLRPERSRRVAAKQRLKWGHAFAMPEFFEEVWTRIVEATAPDPAIGVGQGLNVRKADLREGADDGAPILVRSARFVVDEADGRVARALAAKRLANRIPALILPRGIGDRHWCAFNRGRALSYSHVEVYLPAEAWESDGHYALWAFLNSSAVWLFREITGRTNLGGGLLKAEATDLKTLPLSRAFGFAEEARAVCRELSEREPLPVSKEVGTGEHARIDAMVEARFGIAEHGDAIREALVERVAARHRRGGRPAPVRGTES